MSAFCHLTDEDHGGAFGEDETADQVGSPERLMEVTSQPLLTATLHIRDPRECQRTRVLDAVVG